MKKIISISAVMLTGMTFVLGLTACKSSTSDGNYVIEHVDTLCCCPHKFVYIQPYGDESYFNGLDSELQEDIYALMPEAGYAVEILPAKPIPPSAYYAPKKRYRADKIIALQEAEYKDDHDVTVIGVTCRDISTTIHGQKDYGIMGLSYSPGNSCVVSSYRVRDRKNLHKVVLHEFLHSRGLPHCPKDDPQCYMKDAKGKGNIVKQKYLCKSCQGNLQRLDYDHDKENSEVHSNQHFAVNNAMGHRLCGICQIQ